MTSNLYNVATQMEGKVLIIEIYLKIIFFLLLCQDDRGKQHQGLWFYSQGMHEIF